MTEQAKLTYLQEKIKEAKSMERYGEVALVFGAGFIVIGYLEPSMFPLLVGGIALVLLGFPLSAYGTIQKHKSMEELKHMATIMKCPNCGKQIIEKTPYCPFCGKPLN